MERLETAATVLRDRIAYVDKKLGAIHDAYSKENRKKGPFVIFIRRDFRDWLPIEDVDSTPTVEDQATYAAGYIVLNERSSVLKVTNCVLALRGWRMLAERRLTALNAKLESGKTRAA